MSELQSLSQLHIEFKASLGCIIAYQKKKIETNEKKIVLGN